MRNIRGISLALSLLIGGSLGIAAADQGLLDSTSAAWTDQAQMAATVTAGSWENAPAKNTCVAYGVNGETLSGCAVSNRSYYYGWSESGKQTRNYYLNFDLPNGTRSVSFDVDLRTLMGNESTWSWATAKVVAGAQFTARDGWACNQLPRVRGTGLDWYTSGIYFQVVENGAGSSTMCS